MAFIDKETVKNIRNNLKKEFPETKFSVRNADHIAVKVAIMKSPYFEDGSQTMINHHFIDKSDYPEETKAFVKRVDEIIRTTGGYYNNSDLMTDYFDVAFYYTIDVGKWDNPHVKSV